MDESYNDQTYGHREDKRDNNAGNNSSVGSPGTKGEQAHGKRNNLEWTTHHRDGYGNDDTQETGLVLLPTRGRGLRLMCI